jgi:hypothetical protein
VIRDGPPVIGWEEIRRRQCWTGVNAAAAAREFGISTAVVNDIYRRRTWKHLP